MSTSAETLRDIVIANRILAREEVVDAFGHISIRNPDNSKARGVLGWEPALSLADGLATLTKSSQGTEHAEHISS